MEERKGEYSEQGFLPVPLLISASVPHPRLTGAAMAAYASPLSSRGLTALVPYQVFLFIGVHMHFFKKKSVV